MDKIFSSNIREVKFKYQEPSSIQLKIKKFIIHSDDQGTDVFLITHSDDVYAFGSNCGARLGFGMEKGLKKVTEPTIIPELCKKKVEDIKCGDMHSLALTQLDTKSQLEISRHIYTFGSSLYNRTGIVISDRYHKPIKISEILKHENQTITAIDCTRRSTFALTQSGQLYWFGSLNGYPACGPTKVVFPSETKAEVKIKSISCGYNHVLALTVEGKVFSWGRNEEGQLGLGHNNPEQSPQIITLDEQVHIKQVYCGGYHSFLLTTDEKVYSMGRNSDGRLGIGNKDNQNSPQLALPEQKEFFCYRHISIDIENVCSVYSKAVEYNSVNLREYAFEIMAENMTDLQLLQTTDYKNMDLINANQFLTEYLIRQKNDGSK